MKILFVFKSENFLVPIGICAISAMAKKYGHEVYLTEVHSEDPIKAYARVKPDIIAYSSSTGESKHYIHIDKAIKDVYPKAFSVMGGPHPTFYPEIVKETTIDAACVGEGEEAFIEALANYEKGIDMGNTSNFYTKLHHSNVRPLNENLDDLPYPDYDLFYDNTEMGKYPLKGFMTSHGCPYFCIEKNEKISMSDGTKRCISQLRNGEKILSVDINGKIQESIVSKVWETSKSKRILSIKTLYSQLLCTSEHLILTEYGWVEAGKLKEGDNVVALFGAGKVDMERKNSIILASRKDGRRYRVKGLQRKGLESFCSDRKNDDRKEYFRNSDDLVGFDKIISIEDADYSSVWDIEAYPYHNFIASGIVVHNCTYCFNTAWREIYKYCGGEKIRRHSVDYVIEDVVRVKEKWPLSCVKFQDDVFSFRVDDWLEEFTKKYKQKIGLPFFILTRCDLLDEDMVKLLKEAGCQTISMSIEAGDPIVRLNLLRRKMSNEQIIKAHLLCEKYGISTFTNCIAGIPDTVLKHDVESLDLSLAARVTWAEFPIFYPFPKTELGEYTIAKKYYIPNYSEMHTSYQNSSVLSCFTNEEKRIQLNFGMLASVAVVFPFLRNFIINHLIYHPTNRIFTLAYWISKNYILRKYIYPTKTGWLESMRIFMRSLKQELFRHTSTDK